MSDGNNIMLKITNPTDQYIEYEIHIADTHLHDVVPPYKEITRHGTITGTAVGCAALPIILLIALLVVVIL
jgi:hypothetical protein